MWKTALHNAFGPSMRSGQLSALTPVNVSKGVAHRAQNPGGQNAHTVRCWLCSASKMHRHATCTPTTALSISQRLRFHAITQRERAAESLQGGRLADWDLGVHL